ncbi:MAG: glycosyltransferase family 2 protein [Chloroflexota bacterium]|nr:glycosyltransferase family 2 protein [Chloroflexota bacterium]
MNKASIAVIIPALNEPDSIAAVLAELGPDAARWIFVVVGDGHDPTAEVAARHGACPLVQPRPGYGAACYEGARVALERGAGVLAFIDGDYSDPASELPRVLEPILAGRADLVLGCRDMSRYPDALPLHARAGNRLVLLALWALLGRRLPDLPSFKAVRAERFGALEMRERTYGWTVEMLVKAVRARLRIAEVPVEYRPRLAGRSKVSGTVRGSLGAAWKLVTSAVRYATWVPSPSLAVDDAGGIR